MNITFRHPAACLLTAMCLLSPRQALAQDQHDHDHPMPTRLGTVNFATTCADATKAEFNRATALLHSFTFLAATNAYEKVLSVDPTCGIAAWGIALSAWGNPFAGIKTGVPLEKGSAAVARAQKIGAKSQRERDYIAAVAELYKDSRTVDHPTRIAAYDRAMARVAATYPDDGEAQIFSALASVQTAEPTDKTYAKQLKAGAVLERMFAAAPDHPGLAHYIIHAYDYPPLAPRALDAARRYSQIAPDAAHALHMPSHTFTRVGYWRESVDSNLASAAAAKREGTTAEELHALDYQVYAYLQMAQDDAVRQIVAQLPSIVPRLSSPTAGGGAAPIMAGGFAASAIPARYALERGEWESAASLQPIESAAPQAQAITHFARAVGAARAGKPATIDADIARLVALRDELTAKKDVYWAGQVEIQRVMATAWSAWAAGRKDEALSLAAQGAAAEDATEKAATTPGPIVPAREILAEMLLEAGRPGEARQAYEAVLTKEPRRYRAEYGAGFAAEKAGDLEGAKNHFRSLVEICEKADAPGRDSLQHARAVLGKASGPSARQSQTPYAGHGAESVPREKVAKYAPTPLPGDVTRRIQMMLDVRGAELGTLSPDGKRLFFTWGITGTPNVWRLDGPKAFPIQLTGGEDPTRLAGITPDGKYLVLARDVGGQEDPGLYLQLVDGGPLTEVHHKKGTRGGYAFSTRDSKSIYFLANDIAPDSYAIYRYDIAAAKRELVFDQPGLWAVADHREGQGGALTLLLVKATGALSREFAEYDVATRALTPLFGQNETVEYDASYAPAKGELFVLTNKLGEFRRLYKWKRGGDLVPVTGEMTKDVSGFVVDEARKHVYYSLNDGGYERLRAMDATTLADLKLPLPQDADAVTVGRMTPDGRFATVGVETAKAPRSSYVFDWQTATLTPWTLPSAPEIDLSKFAVAKLDSYTARDGTKIPMFIRYPAQCAPDASSGDACPVVIEFHGGPEGQATPGFSGYAQLFVDSGFIYVEPNVRGSDGYGKAWLDADNGARRLDVITDIDDAGKALRAKFTRNGRAPKVAIVGGSYGGYSALVGMTMFAGTYDAGVSIVGISNLQSFLQNTAPYRRKLRASEYGDPEKDGEALKKLSPVTYIDRVKSPLLMIQGLDDPRVPAGEAIQMQEGLEQRGVPSRLILVEGEGHGAARRGGKVIMIGHMLRFLEEQLGKGAAGTQ